MHAGFCTFDERNAGGRYQTQAELRRFKHVLKNTPSTVDKGDPKCIGVQWKEEWLERIPHAYVSVVAVDEIVVGNVTYVQLPLDAVFCY